jgi:hypothetical protein
MKLEASVAWTAIDEVGGTEKLSDSQRDAVPAETALTVYEFVGVFHGLSTDLALPFLTVR